jgi:hypothetical protein
MIEQKRYAPEIGLVAETTVAGGRDQSELVGFTPGS